MSTKVKLVTRSCTENNSTAARVKTNSQQIGSYVACAKEMMPTPHCYVQAILEQAQMGINRWP